MATFSDYYRRSISANLICFESFGLIFAFSFGVFSLTGLLLTLLFNFNSLLFTGFNLWLLLFFTVLFLYFGAHRCFVGLHYAFAFCGPTFWLLLCGAHFKFKGPAQLFKSWIPGTEENRSEIAELHWYIQNYFYFTFQTVAVCCLSLHDLYHKACLLSTSENACMHRKKKANAMHCCIKITPLPFCSHEHRWSIKR